MLVLSFRVVMSKKVGVVVTNVGFTIRKEVPLGSPFDICVVIGCCPLTQV